MLFDEGRAAARAFGAAAAALGAPVQAVGSDIGSSWINTLEPRFKTGPAAIAGLTAAAPLFCLEYLARDYGLRVVYRIEHAPLVAGRCAHALTGPGALAGSVHELDAAGEHWTECAAALAVGCPADLRPSPSIALLDLAGRRGGAGPALYSWLLAPAGSSGRTCSGGPACSGGSAILARRPYG